MSIRLVVLDMAGTTVADSNAVTTAFQQAFAEFGFDVPAEEITPLMGYKKTSAIRKVLESIGVKPATEQVDSIHDSFVNRMLEHYTSSPDVKPAPNAEETLLWLRENRMVTALNTGFPRQIADAIMQRFEWVEKGLIDGYIASDEVEQGRPHPQMIHRLMQTYNIDDAEQIMKVGDTEVDVYEGRNAGCGMVVGITTGAFSREQLEQHEPDYIIDDLNELKHLLQ